MSSGSAATWWSGRFLAVLESFGMGSRVQRGKRYARAGKVLSLSLSSSLVVALVQGSRPEPYRVRIAVQVFRPAEWERIERALAGAARFAAKLLAGELPAEIDEVFDELGLTLFPATMRELSMDCTCPDWEVPCKHLAAACFVLAESFDADPFQIFAWRGRGRTDLLQRLRALRAAASQPAPPPTLADALPVFWHLPTAEASPGPADSGAADSGPADSGAPSVADPVPMLDRLDPLPVTVRGVALADLLRPAYAAMMRSATQPDRD